MLCHDSESIRVFTQDRLVNKLILLYTVHVYNMNDTSTVLTFQLM